MGQNPWVITCGDRVIISCELRHDTAHCALLIEGVNMQFKEEPWEQLVDWKISTDTSSLIYLEIIKERLPWATYTHMKTRNFIVQSGTDISYKECKKNN